MNDNYRSALEYHADLRTNPGNFTCKARYRCSFVKEGGNDMDYDPVKVDELVLALLHLTSFQDHGVTRAWKGHDWDALNRLHETGLISDPKSKAKSVVLTEDGIRLSEGLFKKYCGKSK